MCRALLCDARSAGPSPLPLLQVGVGHDGHPLLYGAPLVELDDSFPLQQPLLPQLAPQSINMWMGCAPEGEEYAAGSDE